MHNNFSYKKIFILIAFLFGFNSFADRRNELIKVIDLELKEVTRLNKQTRTSNPDLLLRMAELLLEKARLVKEVENIKFKFGKTLQFQKINFY